MRVTNWFMLYFYHPICASILLIKLFLKIIQPESDGEPLRSDTIYKSPIKGLKQSEESPMKSSKKSKSPS